METEIEQQLNNLVFPEHEGLIFEFKKSFEIKHTNKIYETICAFLNTEGGHIIFGIEDENRQIIGLNKSSKEFDLFKLKIDQIYSRPEILTQSNNVLQPCTILCKSYTNSHGKELMYIAVKKNSEQCMLINGITVYRANASNYIAKHEKMYTETEHKSDIRRVTDMHKDTTKTMCESLNKEIKKYKELEQKTAELEKIINAKILEDNELKQKNAELEKLLIVKILEDKVIAEKKLEYEKSDIFSIVYNLFY